MNEKETYDVIDFDEADSFLERHRKDVIEKFMEYQIILLYKFKDENKTIDDYLERIKTALWYVKNQRAQQIHNELGL